MHIISFGGNYFRDNRLTCSATTLLNRSAGLAIRCMRWKASCRDDVDVPPRSGEFRLNSCREAVAGIDVGIGNTHFCDTIARTKLSRSKSSL